MASGLFFLQSSKNLLYSSKRERLGLIDFTHGQDFQILADIYKKKRKKEKSVRVVFKPGHFHGVRSYHISKASDRWLRGGGGDKCHYHLLAHQSVRLPVFSHMGTLTTMPSHFFTYKCNRLTTQSSFCYRLTGLGGLGRAIRSTAHPGKVTAGAPLSGVRTAHGTGTWDQTALRVGVSLEVWP